MSGLASTPMLAQVSEAIERAKCPHREGPFGGYDYGYPGDRKVEGGRFVVRDFRDPNSPTWGDWVHQTDDRETHEREFTRLTREHLARAAIHAMREMTTEMFDAAGFVRGADDVLPWWNAVLDAALGIEPTP